MRIAWVAVTGLAMAGSLGAAQRAVPAEHQGRWVPSKAACESALAVVVVADKVTFVNGKDTEALG